MNTHNIDNLTRPAWWVMTIVLLLSLTAWAQDYQSSYSQPIYTDPNYIPWWEILDGYFHPNRVRETEDANEPMGPQEQRIWGRMFPIFGQEVIDLGFDLPNPYGVALVYAGIKQDMLAHNIRLSAAVNTDPGDPTYSLSSVTVSHARSSNDAVQCKADAWILPFMNVFIMGGYVDGQALLDISIDLDEMFPSVPGEQGVVSTTGKAKYQGNLISVGANLAAGWENYFGVLSMAYAYTDVDIADSKIEAINISPRIGFAHDLNQWGAVAVYTGAAYLHSDNDIKGKVSLDVPPAIGDTLNIGYAVHQQNKDCWNMLLGGNWDVNKNISLQGELGFLGTRDSLIASVTIRF